MNIYSFSLLCFAFSSFLLGLLVWLKRQDDVGKKYIFVVITQAGWAIFLAIHINLDTNYQFILFSARLSHLFSLFIPITWYRFIISYTKGEQNKNFLRIVDLFCLTFIPFIFSPWFIPKMIPIVGFPYFVQGGPLYHLFVIMFFIIVSLSFAELFKKIKSTPAPEKQQFIGLFWIALAGYLGGSLTFLPVYKIPFPQYGMFLLPVYPFGVAYFMIKRGLFDVEELAQAAHRDKLMAIGVLAASINHEIRSPLFLIKGSAENCLEKQKEGLLSEPSEVIQKGNEALQKNIEQADRALDIIKRLSSFAKAGVESKLKIEPVSVAEVIENVLPLVRHELTVNQICFHKEMPENAPKVLADALCLEEIFFNLIVNACQALKEKPDNREIRIAAKTGDSGLGTSPSFFSDLRILRQRTDPSSELWRTGPSLSGRQAKERVPVIVTVQDNGPGIPEDKIDEVFRPFYTTKAEGTGLGLYVVKQIVEKIGGKINVESNIGKGTSFSLSLKGAF
jgi:signal transduction histidine kinase